MRRVAPAFDPTALHADGMPPGDLINLDVGAILAHRPEAAAALGAAMDALRAKGTIGQRTGELIRLRIAFHNQCRSCMAVRYPVSRDDGLTDALVCSLEKPDEAPDLTEAERAALRYADLFATDHLRIDDEVYNGLRRYYTEDQLVEIGLICAISVGIGRLAATWHVVDHVPEELRRQDRVAPWDVRGALTSVLSDAAPDDTEAAGVATGRVVGPG
jgi:alkylhydroperoxidase family enzyme